MSSLRRGLLLLAAALWPAVPRASRADDAHPDGLDDAAGAVTLRVDAPQGSDCPGEVDTSALERQLGGVRLVKPVLLAVVFSRTATGYAATVTASGGTSGTRVLQSQEPFCPALTDALVAAAALIVDDTPSAPPTAAASGGPPSDGTPAEAPAAPIPTASPQPPAAERGLSPRGSPVRSHAQGRYDVDVGGGVGFGIVASTAPAVYAGGTWNLTPRVSMGLEGWGLPQESVSYAPGVVRVWLTAGAAVLCGTPILTASELRISGCVQPLVGVVHGAGVGYDTNRTELQPWVALAAGLRAGGPIAGSLRWLRWSARLEPLLLLDRQGFSVGNLGVGYVPQPVGLLAGLGLSAEIL